MIKVKISTGSPTMPFYKQTPGESGVIGNVKFFIDDDTKEADWWVVVEGTTRKETVKCPPENTILITHESHMMRDYEKKFTDQFYRIITAHQTMDHPRKIYSQQAHLPHLFWARREQNQSLEDFKKQYKSFDEIQAMSAIPKTKLLTAVASNKVNNPRMQMRVDFITALKKHFGDRMDVFSNAPNAFGPETKVAKFEWDALAPYKYCVAVENCFEPHYWTSKIGSPFTTLTYPFYHGHPSVLEYFPKDALTFVDGYDLKKSIEIIEKGIKDNLYEKHLPDLRAARKLVLEKYNLLHMVAEWVNKLPSGKEAKKVTIRPERLVPWTQGVLVKLLTKNRIVRSVAKATYKGYRKIRYHQK